MIGPAGFMAAPKPRDCDCPGGKCQPERNEGKHCWRTGAYIPDGEFSSPEGSLNPRDDPVRR